jgi:hypothetical protein
MRLTSKATLSCAAALLALAAPNQTQAQRDSTGVKGVVTVTPGAQYKAGALKRAIFGGGWRDVWTTPVQAPVLDIGTHAGGLKLNKRGGGFHSYVLHLDETNGWREYRFRSVDKFPSQGLPPAVRGTVVGNVFQDQVSVFFPAAPLMVHPLLEAVGVLHVEPELYVMGDSPLLQDQRDLAKGMLGTMELKGEEAPDDKPGFGGSAKITDTEGFFEDLIEGRQHRLDEREFLAARLIDILINDPDRSPDNYDWARFGEKGAYTWRPLPRDRDQAFINARGLLNTFVFRAFYPKQVAFSSRIPLKGLTYSSHVFDRRLLQRLTAEDFREVGLRVQHAITDSVIDIVVGELPTAWREQTTADEQLVSALRARRDALPGVAMAFYRQLAGEVDLRGTDEADRVFVERHSDGRVTVTITDPAPPRPLVAERREGDRVVTTSDGGVAGRDERGPYFSRTFVPGETKEIRLYAQGGDDVAIVRGVSSRAITVRLIGGKGDDILADSAGGRTILYDAEGTNRLIASSDTRVDTRPWKEILPDAGFRTGSDWKPDWGRSRAWRPAIDYNTASGLIIGIGPRFRDYGFRRLPYQSQVDTKLWYGTTSGGFGFTLAADYRAENSPRAFRVEALATQLEATRFFGYGNTAPATSRALSVVHQNMISVEPAAVWHIGFRSREGQGNPIRGEDTLPARLRSTIGEFRVGPSFTWIDPDPVIGSPLFISNVRGGTQSFGIGGAVVGLELDRTDDDAVPTFGYRLDAELGAYPLFGDAFGTAAARGALYLPLRRIGSGPHLAFRAGASMATGEYPAQFAAAIGGRSTVRGYSWRRFAGDVATNGSAELRVPVGTVNLLLKSQLGVFALADAGRVWFDGRSDGDWHTGVGGGIWLAALGRSVSLAYAKGETPRWYISSGLFY